MDTFGKWQPLKMFDDWFVARDACKEGKNFPEVLRDDAGELERYPNKRSAAGRCDQLNKVTP